MCSKKLQYGQYNTPLKYVGLASEWLSEYIDPTYIILDSSCGDGVFFALSWNYPHNHFVGADIDRELIEKNRQRHLSFAEFYHRNSLYNVSRISFNISPKAKLCVVGNPPYNNQISKQQRYEKGRLTAIDEDIKTKDLGICFLNSYDKLEADIALILHPLSYIIKPRNRRYGKRFFNNYGLKKHIIFSSEEFTGTTKYAPFPIIMGLYIRDGKGISDVDNMEFVTEEGDTFKLNEWDYISSYCSKYPMNGGSGIWFYSMRDVNYLSFNKGFVAKNPTASCINIDINKLGYYCYVDLFKRYAPVPYWMGNFNIPVPKNGISEAYLNFFTRVDKQLNQEVFGVSDEPTAEDVETVKRYMFNVVNRIPINQ